MHITTIAEGREAGRAKIHAWRKPLMTSETALARRSGAQNPGSDAFELATCRREIVMFQNVTQGSKDQVKLLKGYERASLQKSD
ncbi:hypothetical protein A6U94_27485 [Agrobacterium tumefaciens]|nr:hypothetical protein A6U94_27485 [Agrobacterium tumefaciens]